MRIEFPNAGEEVNVCLNFLSTQSSEAGWITYIHKKVLGDVLRSIICTAVREIRGGYAGIRSAHPI